MVIEARELQQAAENLAGVIDDRLAPYKRDNIATHHFLVPGSEVEQFIKKSMLPNFFRNRRLGDKAILALSLSEPGLLFRLRPLGRPLVIGRPLLHIAELNVITLNTRKHCPAFKLSVSNRRNAKLRSLRALPAARIQVILQETDYSEEILESFRLLISQAEDISLPNKRVGSIIKQGLNCAIN